MRIPPAFQSFVLIGKDARIDRPRKFDTSRVIKADQLKKAIWRDIDNENLLIGAVRFAAKIVSSETVEFVARQLAELHRPLSTSSRTSSSTSVETSASPQPIAQRGRRIEPTLGAAPSPAQAKQPATPACKNCSSASGEILYGRYGYYFKCRACGTNTAMRFTCKPGHKPRLRKDRNRFFHECEQCGKSELVHTNDSGAAAR